MIMLKEREKPDQIQKREISDKLKAAESDLKHFQKKSEEFSSESLFYRQHFRNEEARNEMLERELKANKMDFQERLEAFKKLQNELDQSKSYISLLEKENTENISCLMFERNRLYKENNRLIFHIEERNLKRLAKKRKKDEEAA
tara:strand:- start:206 stop:637 length:432 start_codon:yes stop_codon:yes gene_type:complete